MSIKYNTNLFYAILIALVLHIIFILFVSPFNQSTLQVQKKLIPMHINPVSEKAVPVKQAQENALPEPLIETVKKIEKEALPVKQIKVAPQVKPVENKNKITKIEHEKKSSNVVKIKPSLQVKREKTVSSNEVVASIPPAKEVKNNDENSQSVLLEIIYSAIAQHRKYPYRARKRKQQGSVYIAFQLSPAGLVSDIQILAYSGFSLLDQSAIDAVAAISPIATAPEYLQKTETFSVHIDYRLK